MCSTTRESTFAYTLFAQLATGKFSFFVQPYSRCLEIHFVDRLKSLDLVCMKKLDSKVNIIPVIAKADTISKPELMRFKVTIKS